MTSESGRPVTGASAKSMVFSGCPVLWSFMKSSKNVDLVFWELCSRGGVRRQGHFLLTHLAIVW